MELARSRAAAAAAKEQETEEEQERGYHFLIMTASKCLTTSVRVFLMEADPAPPLDVATAAANEAAGAQMQAARLPAIRKSSVAPGPRMAQKA